MEKRIETIYFCNMDNKEIWKFVNGTDEVYSVSNFGRIRHNETNHVFKGRTYHVDEYIVEPKTWQNPKYLRVDLSLNRKEPKRVCKYVHAIVAEHFLGKRPEGLVIDHIDGNSFNNRVDNLRYVTQKENANNPNTKTKITRHKWTDEEKKRLSDKLKIVMNSPEINAKLHVPHKHRKKRP